VSTFDTAPIDLATVHLDIDRAYAEAFSPASDTVALCHEHWRPAVTSCRSRLCSQRILTLGSLLLQERLQLEPIMQVWKLSAADIAKKPFG
jgi:hypothetical protein